MNFVRMYRGDDHAPPGPDQDQVPAAELESGWGGVHRGQGLRQEDVCPGDNTISRVSNVKLSAIG